MSLINDALKRANQAQKKKPHTANAGSMQPVQSPGAQPRSWTPIVVGLVLAVLGLGFFFWKGGNKEEVQNVQPAPPEMAANSQAAAPQSDLIVAPDTTSTARPVNEQPRGEPPPAVRAALDVPVVRQPASAPVVEPPPIAEVVAPVTSTTVRVAQPPVTAAETASDELKLQGIFYRLRNPTAMINGETVGPGETVAGARVISIERTSVIISRGGQQEILKLKR